MQKENDSSSIKKLHGYLHQFHHSKMHEAQNATHNLFPGKMKLNLSKVIRSNNFQANLDSSDRARRPFEFNSVDKE